MYYRRPEKIQSGKEKSSSKTQCVLGESAAGKIGEGENQARAYRGGAASFGPNWNRVSLFLTGSVRRRTSSILSPECAAYRASLNNASSLSSPSPKEP